MYRSYWEGVCICKVNKKTAKSCCSNSSQKWQEFGLGKYIDRREPTMHPIGYLQRISLLLNLFLQPRTLLDSRSRYLVAFLTPSSGWINYNSPALLKPTPLPGSVSHQIACFLMSQFPSSCPVQKPERYLKFIYN